MKKLMKDDTLKVALYSRLSKDDGDKAESNSITNQKALLLDYIDNNLENVVYIEEYVDDGYTGLNTDRPAFTKMIEDVKNGSINCVVVKDLSRFGRNSWEVGKYLEQIFPFLNIRFIAINDMLDNQSENFADNILIPFKNMINEAYSRDISSKIRSQFEIKRKQGDFIGNFAPYGYMKDENNHNKLIVDKNVKTIVQNIFRWKIEGLSNYTIANKLNDLGVLSPAEYKKSIGLNYNTALQINKKALWNHTVINWILSNEIYIGNLAQGKKKTPNLKVKKFFLLPEDKWIKVKDTHEAIISRDDFFLVRELLKMDTKKSPNEECVYNFAGIIKCNDCGETMVRVNTIDKGKKYYYYVCGAHKYKRGCSSHRISEKKLTDMVAKTINNEIKYISDFEEIYKSLEVNSERNITLENLYNQIKLLNEDISTHEKYKKSLIEVYSKNLIDEEFFITNMDNYNNSINNIKENINNVIDEIEETKLKNFASNNIIENFKQYKGFKELTRPLIVNLIRSIEVLERKDIIINFRHTNEAGNFKKIVFGGDFNG